ncbi:MULTISPECIES: phosphotransferase family protein [unclassified Caulobacter]|uniref:phosphotransferase family protein n=1 Tax=unclassified Caulobacter TaxID=2648921 RepID=UPI000D3A80D5|nr:MULTISPECIES: phosphotransferase family protein [unclassified Caulobacter]PTS87410.1 phosphotransferase family protein [Caulobacter sp. HMWF009]PTT11673.1 phosphotransferase family protein [Caulobacter sp. HMWF025]
MTLAERLERYLTRYWDTPTEVSNLSRIPGGASRETYRFDALVKGQTRPLILRRDPPGSLIDTDRRLEFLAFQSFHGRAPVPEPIVLEAEGTELERPFFIMSRVDGGAAASPFTVDPYGEHAQAIGEAFFGALGAIAAVDPSELPLGAAAASPDPAECWRVALDEWAGVIEADEQHPQPIVRAAIRRLRRAPPPPPVAVRVVHGDYRTGNFLHDGQGKILALLDWEMAHIGDPLEDLAWAIDPLWSHYDTARVAGMLPRAEALDIWSRTSGLPVDAAALAWWELFSAVKGQAIWTSAAREYRDGGFKDPVLAISGWYTARRHDEILAERLMRLEGLS